VESLYNHVEQFITPDRQISIVQKFDLNKKYVAWIVFDKTDMPEAITFLNQMFRPGILPELM
jgi:hypothetical protein